MDTMSDMDLDEIREEKKKLEKQINSAISNFVRETGVSVQQVGLRIISHSQIEKRFQSVIKLEEI